MLNVETKKNFLKTSAVYAGIFISSLLILVLVRQLWKADLKIPIYNYQTDPLYYSTVLVKGMIDNGWYLSNSYLGMPFGSSMYDYPDLYTFDLLLIKFITLFIHDWPLAVNIFLIFTFPFTATVSMLVMRALKISWIPAFVTSLLFTFIPYHLIRGIGHLFLSDYSSIPLAVLLCLWVCTDEKFMPISRKNRLLIDISDKRLIYAVLICIYVSLAAVYYVFFACFFLCVAGFIGSIKFNNLNRILVTLILVGVIAIGFFINLLPSIMHEQSFSSNTEISYRAPGDAETYGLKIIQLLLPTAGHRINFLAKINAKYSANFPLVNENSTSSLGIIGGLGFVLLVIWIFYRKKDNRPSLIDDLSLMNISAILLATIGGGGAIIALVISPQIRAYNRISVFIAFFSLLAVSIFIDQMFLRFLKSPHWKVIVGITALLILSVGIMDQTNNSTIPDYKAIKMNFYNDKNFVEKIERTVEPNSMIFQLPYIPFLVNPTVNRMLDYDLLRGYAHSKTLRWSYGIMGGSYGDRWQQQVSSEPIDKFIESVSFAGFSGIYIDRYGYADDGLKLEKQISDILHVIPIVSNNRRLVFYDMRLYNDSHRAQYTEEQWQAEKTRVLYPIDTSWTNGFSMLEGTADNNWRWSSNSGILILKNYTNTSKTITIKMSVATYYSDKSTMQITGKDFSDTLEVNSEPKAYSRTIVVPPGEYRIKFISNAKRVDVLAELRKLNFYIKNFSITEE